MKRKKSKGQVFGESHGRAILTEKIVKQMRAAAKAADKAGTTRPVAEWSEKLGMSKGAISMAMSGQTWADTPGAAGDAAKVRRAAKKAAKKPAKKAAKKAAKKTAKKAGKKTAKKAAKKATRRK